MISWWGELCLPVPALVARGSAEALGPTSYEVVSQSSSNPSKADGAGAIHFNLSFQAGIFKKKITKKPTNKQIGLSAIKWGEKYFDFNDAVHVSDPLTWD